MLVRVHMHTLVQDGTCSFKMAHARSRWHTLIYGGARHKAAEANEQPSMHEALAVPSAGVSSTCLRSLWSLKKQLLQLVVEHSIVKTGYSRECGAEELLFWRQGTDWPFVSKSVLNMAHVRLEKQEENVLQRSTCFGAMAQTGRSSANQPRCAAGDTQGRCPLWAALAPGQTPADMCSVVWPDTVKRPVAAQGPCAVKGPFAVEGLFAESAFCGRRAFSLSQGCLL